MKALHAVTPLTLITQTSRLSGDAFFQTLTAALEGGLGQVLVREKTMDSAHLLAFASRIRNITRHFQAKLIIHSQADIAKAVGADGVHLSSLDMHEIPAMRQWLNNSNMHITTACHNTTELKMAERYGADAVYLSPVFTTQTHPEAEPLGLDRFQELAQSTSLPVIALGGIQSENRQQLADYPVAVIGAILDAEDPKQNAQRLCTTMRQTERCNL